MQNAADMTHEQRKILNAACGDLAEQITWHGIALDKDDWRHLISGAILGWRMVPGIDRGEGPPGLIMFARSSMELTRANASDAITQAFAIGDDPTSQGLKCAPVRWGAAVCKARWLIPEERT